MGSCRSSAATARRPPHRRVSSSGSVEGVARLLIAAGILLLAYTAAQLWGTDLTEAEAQRRLAEAWTPPPVNPIGVTPIAVTPAPTDSVSTSDDPVVAAPARLAEIEPQHPSAIPARPLPRAEPGQAVATLEIPAIELSKTVVYGTDRGSLQQGPGLYPGTAWPGRTGNSAIAGHRTTYGAPFRRIDELQPGDEIVVTTDEGRFVYLVDAPSPALAEASIGHVIVAPEAVQVLSDHGDNRLTLTSCHPLHSARERIVVTATLRGAPVDEVVEHSPPPAGAVTETVAGRAAGPFPSPAATPIALGEATAIPSPWWPVARWILTTLAIVAATRLIELWWQRWPTYAVAAPPLIMSLISLFLHLDRALSI